MTPFEKLKQKNEFDGELQQGTRHFNISTGRDDHIKRVEEKQASIVDPDTGFIYEKLSTSRVCPVCESSVGKEIFCKNGFRHNRCQSCNMVYVNPVLNEERLHSFYQNEESYTRVLLNENQLEMDIKKFNYGMDIIEEYMPAKGKLLDVGCGPGISLKVAKERGWDVQGIEFNTWCIKNIRNMNIPVVDQPLKEVGFPENYFECVTLWTVLEHVMEPGELLADIFKVLSPGGILLLLVPNLDSLANRILHEKSTTFSGDSHVNLFNAQSISRLLKKSGFIVKECETILTRIGTINNYLNYEDPQFGEGTPVLEYLTPEYIHDNLLGYLLMVLAQVPKS